MMAKIAKEENIANPDKAHANHTRTVFVIEDDPIQRELLVNLLESAHYCVSAYTTPLQFIAEYKPERPGCIVSDILMPGMNGLEMLEALTSNSITMPVIYVTGHADVAMVKTALKLGAIDILEKPLKTVELLSAIKEGIKRDAEIRQRKQQIETIHNRLRSLTAREREILDLLVAGYANKQIARERQLSLRTVETHRTNILKKMDTGTFTELLRLLLAYPDVESDAAIDKIHHPAK